MRILSLELFFPSFRSEDVGRGVGTFFVEGEEHRGYVLCEKEGRGLVSFEKDEEAA